MWDLWDISEFRTDKGTENIKQKYSPKPSLQMLPTTDPAHTSLYIIYRHIHVDMGAEYLG